MPTKRDESWQGRVKVNRKTYTRDGFEAKREAQEWEQEKRKELLSESGHQPLGLLLLTTEYLTYCKRLSKRTYDEKLGVMNRALVAFGQNTPVISITPIMFLKYFTARAAKVSAYAANKDRKNLHAMFEWANQYMEGFNYNPITRIKSLPHDRAAQYVPPEADVLKVVMACNREQWIFLDMYLQTGARKSEIFRLAWEDIDFQNHKIRLGTRKTRDGSLEYRLLDMSDELNDNLQWWWKNRPIKDTPLVFINTDERSRYYGKPYKVRQKFMKGLCKRAQVKEFGFHALRRYVASILASKRVPAKVIQGILGHHSMSTTERYIYNITHDQRDCMNLLQTNTENVDPNVDLLPGKV